MLALARLLSFLACCCGGTPSVSPGNLHSRSVALMDVYVNQTGMMRITVMASIVGDVMAMQKSSYRDARIYGYDWEARA